MQIGLHDDESKRCTFHGCSQVHLLASRCSFCGGFFCCDHTSVSAHNCRVFNAEPLACPLCRLTVPLEFEGQLPDDAVSRHIDRGCRSTLSPTSRGKEERKNQCSCEGCTSNDGTSVVCEDCGNMYCIQHRAPARHECRMTGGSSRRILTEASSPTCKPHASSAGSPTVAFSSKRTPRNTPSTAFGTRTEDAVTPLLFFAEEFCVAPFYMHFPRLMVVGRLLDLAVRQAALDSAAVNGEKGPWVLHVIKQSIGTHGVSLFESRLSVTLHEASVENGTVIYIGKQRTVPERVIREIKKNYDRHVKSKKKSCSFM